jgi:uncharacterized protein YndB with AHSA1/START domain
MTDHQNPKLVSAGREVAASAETIFELIADPKRQPLWDGNGNLANSEDAQRVRALGAMFVMKLTNGAVRHNHVVEFTEARRIAWTPAEAGKRPPGHLWRWELEPLSDARTRVTHSYDWSRLTDEQRLARARATTSEMLQASLDRLAELAERH